MPDVPVADAMEEAQAVIDADTLAAIDEVKAAASSDAPVQVPLFEPPPFDFEQAYDELHRLDQRARLRKSEWEIAKSDASDAKKSYDTAIEDLHKKFAEIERARSESLKPRAETNHESEVMPMSDEMEMDVTIDEPTPPMPEEPEQEKEEGAPID